jgi:hypothetical protein
VTDVAEAAQARTARAEQTRAAITEAALALFRERGYEAATMRAPSGRASPPATPTTTSAPKKS